MATENRWTAYDTISTYLTTELNALGIDANKLGAAIDFAASGTDRKLYMDIEFVLASVDLSAQTNPAFNVWMVPRTDGTNFADGDDSVNPAQRPDAIVPFREFNGAQRVMIRRVITTPDQGKLLIENVTGAALAATGNTVKINVYSEQSV